MRSSDLNPRADDRGPGVPRDSPGLRPGAGAGLGPGVARALLGVGRGAGRGAAGGLPRAVRTHAPGRGA